MLNESFCLAAGATRDTMGVVWRAPSDDAVSFIFVNGKLETERFAPGRAERAIDVPWPPGMTGVIEIHDFAPAEAPDPPPSAITVPPSLFTLPVLHFTPVPAAARYRIYHRPEDGPERRIADFGASGHDSLVISFPCDEVLDGRALTGKWHFFRVEAVTPYGVESRRQSWAWRAMDTPPAPVVTVTAGSVPGRYDFSV